MKSISWRIVAALVTVSMLFSLAGVAASPQKAAAAALLSIPYTSRANPKADLC